MSSPFKPHFKSEMQTIYIKEGQTYFDALWESGLFTSKNALRRLFKEGAIKKV